ncbi:hypothetical protein ABZ490_21155 [Streptomyces sp. NPDC005811]|uniref:hypothetical protein n=1 Tax=Streptomyces sp. NPDC005811 TaxID=3154565 RepID=UPI0033CB8290
MGASCWDYVTPYTGGVEESLRALHAAEFAREYGADGTYASLEELWADAEFMSEEGTHSILDIPHAVGTCAPPDAYAVEDANTLRPLPADRVRHHFGSGRPTPERFREVYDSGPALSAECAVRWTGRYVLLYTGDRPSHLGVFGCSGD